MGRRRASRYGYRGQEGGGMEGGEGSVSNDVGDFGALLSKLSSRRQTPDDRGRLCCE